MTIVRRVGRLFLWLLLLVLALLLAFRLAAWAREDGAPVPPTTSLVATPLGKVAVTATGPADGPPVLLVHGTAAWGGFWRDIAADLAVNGYRAVAVDLPPFGFSDHDRQARYDRTAQAQRLAAVADAFGGRATIVGHSFGAGPATEAVLRHPDRFTRLVLVDAALGKLDPPTGEGTLAAIAGAPPVGQLVIGAIVTNPMMTGTMLKSFMHRDSAADAWIDTIRQPMAREGTTAAYAEWLPQLVVANDDSRSRRRAELQAIRVPVAIIWGERDDVTPPAQGRELQRLTRARSLELLPGVGHIPHVEAPELFKPALLRALAPGDTGPRVPAAAR